MTRHPVSSVVQYVLSRSNRCLLASTSSRAPSVGKFQIIPSHCRARTARALARGYANEPHHHSFHGCHRISLSFDYSNHILRGRYVVCEALVWIGSYGFWSYKGARAQVIVGGLHPIGSLARDDILLQYPMYSPKQASCLSLVQ